tara:strand:+ start:4343 stop:4882 length:540 start_codon:yes stop_codon:yes gene_type:complete
MSLRTALFQVLTDDSFAFLNDEGLDVDPVAIRMETVRTAMGESLAALLDGDEDVLAEYFGLRDDLGSSGQRWRNVLDEAQRELEKCFLGVDALQQLLSESMRDADVTALTDGANTATMHDWFGRIQFRVVDPAMVPEEYLRTRPAPTNVDPVTVRIALRDGETIPGIEQVHPPPFLRIQ